MIATIELHPDSKVVDALCGTWDVLAELADSVDRFVMNHTKASCLEVVPFQERKIPWCLKPSVATWFQRVHIKEMMTEHKVIAKLPLVVLQEYIVQEFIQEVLPLTTIQVEEQVMPAKPLCLASRFGHRQLSHLPSVGTWLQSVPRTTQVGNKC